MQAAQRLKARVWCCGMNFGDACRLPHVIDGGVALNEKNDRAEPNEELLRLRGKMNHGPCLIHHTAMRSGMPSRLG